MVLSSGGGRKPPPGLVLYDGPSLFDGSPVVCVLTGVGWTSSNHKTGPMLQTWILRSDLSPLAALATDADRSVCGTCRFRGERGKGRSCYVAVVQAPTQVYHTLANGRYEPASKALLKRHAAGRACRFGSYGDPCAVPLPVWQELARFLGAGEYRRPRHRGGGRGRMPWTGYTQVWRTCDPGYREFLMASVVGEAEALEARHLGWRTYRVREPGTPLMPGEFTCPSSNEAGRRSDCFSCRRCDGGTGGRSPAIVGHGSRPTLGNLKRMIALTLVKGEA